MGGKDMNVITFTPPPDRIKAEADLVVKLKAVVYEYSELITVAQAIGCIHIAAHEVEEEQK